MHILNITSRLGYLKWVKTRILKLCVVKLISFRCGGKRVAAGVKGGQGGQGGGSLASERQVQLAVISWQQQ